MPLRPSLPLSSKNGKDRFADPFVLCCAQVNIAVVK